MAIKKTKDKAIHQFEDKSIRKFRRKVEKKAEGELQTFFFPTLNKTVKARNLEEAEKIIKNL